MSGNQIVSKVGRGLASLYGRMDSDVENEKEGAGVKFIVDHRSITARSLKKIVVDHAPAGTSTNQAGAVKWLLAPRAES